MKDIWTYRLRILVMLVMAGGGLFTLVVVLSGKNPVEVVGTLIGVVPGVGIHLRDVVPKAVPILFCALAVSIPGKMGQVNLGGEGQFLLGAIGATMVVKLFHGFSIFGVPLMILVALAFGGLWGGLPGLLKRKYGANETLLSLLLNYVAQLLLLFSIHGPLRDSNSAGWPQSQAFPEIYRLRFFFGEHQWGLATVGVVLCILLAFISARTQWGFTAKLISSSPRNARYLLVNVHAYTIIAFLLAGVLAGFGGLGEVAGVQGRLRDGISLGYGYAGFFVGWLCGHRFMLLPLGSLVFAWVVTGADSLQVLQGMPFATVSLLQGLAFLGVLLYPRLVRDQMELNSVSK